MPTSRKNTEKQTMVDRLNDLYDDYESPESRQNTKDMWKRLLRKTIYAHKHTEDGVVQEEIEVFRTIFDDKFGTIYEIRAAKEYFHFRMTPSGLLRVGPIKKNGVDMGIIDGG